MPSKLPASIPGIMKLPFGLRWLPGLGVGLRLSDSDRLMLALSLSLLLHGPLLLRLLPDGSPQGQPQRMHVRLARSAHAASQAASLTACSGSEAAAARRLDRAQPAVMPRSQWPGLASAAQAQQPRRAHRSPSAGCCADQSLAAYSATPATTKMPCPAMGLDFYYAARQVDVLALEQLPIQLVAPYGLGMDDVDVTLRVYINEQGTVDAVQMVSARPAGQRSR
jgi:hypothetical protein